MNLFLADSLNISIQLLFAVLVIVSLLLLGVVLMQRPKQEGLGAAFGAAITDQAFGARTTDVLKKATVYFGTAFMVLCLGLGMLINRQHVKSSESLPPGRKLPFPPRRRKNSSRRSCAGAPLRRKPLLLRLRPLLPQKPLSPPTKGAFFLNTPAAGRRRGVCAPGLFRLLPFREQALK